MNKQMAFKEQGNLLSVIVACYNVAEYLSECLDSLASQTFKNVEVIMIDDASEDETSLIVERYAQKYDNFTAIHNEQNLGPSASRNKGINLANGQWIAFVDGDDIVPSNAYEVMINSLIKSHSTMVTGFVRRFDKNRDKPSFLHKKAIIDDYRHTSFEKHPELLYDTTSWNKLYSTSLLRQNEIFFPINQIYEDVAFTLKAFLYSDGIDIITKPVYYWRWRDSNNVSFTQSKNEISHYLDRLKSFHQVVTILQKHELWDEKVKHQLLFKLLDVDIPLFMDDIADADDSFVYAFQETTVNFFRKWQLLNSPIIKELSAKKQYQYYALINGKFDFLKQLSFGQPLNGRIAKLERKNAGLPTFYSPKKLNVGIDKVRLNDNQFQFTGKLQVGKKSPHYFPVRKEIVDVVIENINTGNSISLNSFKRFFTLFNFHLKKMTAPASRFQLDFNLLDCLKNLGPGTYKIRFDYQINPNAKKLSVYLGQPRKGAGKITPFTLQDGELSVIYGHNTNWDTVIKVIPSTELASGDSIQPTVVETISLDDQDNLVLKGISNEEALQLEINEQIFKNQDDDSKQFQFRLPNEFLETFLNHASKVEFRNPITGLEVKPEFSNGNRLTNILSSKHLSIRLEQRLKSGLWIKPDVPTITAQSIQIKQVDKQFHLTIELNKNISSITDGKLELLSSNLVNRYLNIGSLKLTGQKIVGQLLIGDYQQLSVLAGNYTIYLNLNQGLGEKSIAHRFKVSAPNLTSQNATIGQLASVEVKANDAGELKLSVKQNRPWIDRSKVRRGIAYSIIYPLMRLLPLEKNTVVFESLWGQSYNDSPRAMYQYLVEHYPNMKFVWILKNEQTPIDGPGIRVRRLSFKYWYYMARAKYLIQNTNFPTQYAKRRGQIEVETLHGTFMKVMGFDEPHFKNATNRVQKNFATRIGRWDLMSVPSDFMYVHGSTAFDYPEQKILKTGFPRTDELIYNNHPDYIKKIKSKLGIPADKKVVLYAPTYRTTDMPFNFQLDLEKMKQQLSDEYVLLVRLHYFVSHTQNFIDQTGFVYDVSDYNNINDLYLISDVLITDYSSVMFDFGYLKRPMIFFAYDKEWYLDPANRGIYMDYDTTVPGPVAKTTESVIKNLQQLDSIKKQYSGKLEQFYERFCQYGRTGDATKQLTEAMLNLNPKVQDSVVKHLILTKIGRLLKLTNLQSKLLNYLGQVLPKTDIAIFESFFGRQYSDNPKAIYEYMKIHYPNIKSYWNVNPEYEQYFIDHNIPYVQRFSFKGIWKQARAKYWFTNVRRPFRWNKPKDTIVVQTWHGTPLKTIGTDVQQVTMPGVTRMKYHKQVARDSARWDYLLTPNPYSYEIMQRAFRKQYPQLLPTGYPRNDRLSQPSFSEINSIKKQLGIKDGSKVVLYAPTWRDNDYVRADHFKAELHLDLKKFLSETSSDTCILIRTHYLIANNLDLSGYGNRVINVSDYEDITDLYLISDLLITDYSSVFFDYSILRRPILFFAYDLKAYANDIRGFYVDYHATVPGPIVETNEALMPLIKRALHEPATFVNTRKYKTFLNKFAIWEDGHATERLLKTVLEQQPAYHLRDISSNSPISVGNLIKVPEGTILWTGIPGLPDTEFIGNFDSNEIENSFTVKQIATLEPRDFSDSGIFTGGTWIKASINNNNQTVWISSDAIIHQ
ncbi:bifunctional glycosyltransferase/CDP-glycerol:glycerophosphate glycerophosphotransferase [Pediococcus acidilactici]|uniref:bifunctional glycosyltransferase/CDP-glycerol:glycerophosphate glycerophosphotransferase n=1 Tax=Pediococcus acidilactici TaxID=1254 RepID=UPI001F4FF6B7|nr:bifunctional glycosyltransferase family 2 protein/CDP-glycerol:glycerophosphate glycerophosphotransferase [Pediococcus acidilactici]